MLQPSKINLLEELDPTTLFKKDWINQFIIDHHSSFTPEHEYLRADFYKEGKIFKDFGLEGLLETKDLSSLPCSFRLTNIQLLEPAIFKMCQRLERELSRNFTCNLYFTPGADRNCFDFHVDHQITYVSQIMGKKEWIFPLEGNQIITYLDEKPFTPDMLKEHHFTKLLLMPGDHLLVPYRMVHKVEIRGETPSLHLTFGSLEHTQQEFVQGLVTFALAKAGLDKTQLQTITQTDLNQLLDEIKSALSDNNTKEYVSQFRAKTFADSLKATKFGRPYKKNLLANQD